MPCTVPFSNRTGKYSWVECSNPEDSIVQNLCMTINDDIDHCEDFYCCPEIPEMDFCMPTRREIYGTNEIISNSCYDTFRKREGVCRPRGSCPIIDNDEANSNKTIECGKDCCTTFICCPNEDLTKLTVMEQSNVNKF